jgi:hypothetical protein
MRTRAYARLSFGPLALTLQKAGRAVKPLAKAAKCSTFGQAIFATCTFWSSDRQIRVTRLLSVCAKHAIRGSFWLASLMLLSWVRSRTMRSKIFSALKALIFVTGATALQACFFGGGHPYYSQPAPYAYGPSYGPPSTYAYAGRPAYGYAVPPRDGDYDDHHQWHDRGWWVQNNHPWVQQHHTDWIGHSHDDHDRH